jgi:hypothetical protein
MRAWCHERSPLRRGVRGVVAVDARVPLPTLLSRRRNEPHRPEVGDGAHKLRADKRYAAQTEAFIHDPRGALPHDPMVLHRGGWPDGS